MLVRGHLVKTSKGLLNVAVKEEPITTWERLKDLSHGGGRGIIGLLDGVGGRTTRCGQLTASSVLLLCSLDQFSSPPAPLHTCSPIPPTTPSASLCLQ